MDHYLWFCDNCGIIPGGSGGMTFANNLQCPECQHYRCEFCITEPMLGRKMIEKPRKLWREHGDSRFSLLPSPPSMPTISLALLQKVPTEKQVLTLLQEGGVKNAVNVPHTSELEPIFSPQGYPTSIVEVRPIALSDISPPTSPPALSPNPSDTSFCSSDPANSEVTSPTMTDLGSDITTSALEETDHVALIESESESLTALLDSRLLSVLGYDLELAARLIPRIHALIKWRFASKKIGVTVVPSQAGEDGNTSPGAVSSSSPAVSRTVKPTDLQRRKHIRDPDEEDEARRNRGSKRPRKRFGPDSPRPLGFACPFYRKDPEKYGVATDIKYRTCGGPGPYEVRRIKDHFKSSHRTPQCDRCYCIFEDVTQLTDHRRSEPPCAQKGIELKEGIDDGQWEMIERLLSRKRGASQSENEKHDIEKWFGIWTILFPNISPPKHPWSDTGPVKTAPLTLHVANLIDTLDGVIELDIERGNLQRNDYVHERYRLAVRQVLETAMAVSPLPPLDFHSGSSGLQDFSPGSAGSPNQLLSTSLSPHPLGQSPMGLLRGYRIQDATSQPWTPRSQVESSTPSASTQNSLATQWGTPQDLSTPMASSSLDTPAGPRDPSTVSSQVQSETPGYELDETLPLQIEWSEEWDQLQNFESIAAISQDSGAGLGIPLLDSEQRIPNENLLPEDDTSDAAANNDSLTAILESEIELPTAGTPFKDHRDRNKGLQKPFYED